MQNRQVRYQAKTPNGEIASPTGDGLDSAVCKFDGVMDSY